MTTPDIIANLEAAYAAKLAERAQQWELKHPDDAKQLRESVAAKFRPAGKPDPEPGSLAWLTLEAAVVEAIRVKKGWPTERVWIRLQAGCEPDPPMFGRDVLDRKAISAGEK